MKLVTLAWFAVAAGLLIAVSCGEGETAVRSCQPGIQRACLGPGQCDGTEQCNMTVVAVVAAVRERWLG
jgi:hypothetical protein